MVVLAVLTGVPALLGHQLSPGGIWVWRAVAQDQLWAQLETRSSIQIFTEVIGQSDFKDRGQRGRGNVFFYGMGYVTEEH